MASFGIFTKSYGHFWYYPGCANTAAAFFKKHNIETKDKSLFDVADVHARTPSAFDSISLLHSADWEAPDAQPTPRAAPSQQLHSQN